MKRPAGILLSTGSALAASDQFSLPIAVMTTVGFTLFTLICGQGQYLSNGRGQCTLCLPSSSPMVLVSISRAALDEAIAS